MSSKHTYEKAKQSFIKFKSIDISAIKNKAKNLSGWNGMNIDDFIETFMFNLDTLDKIFSIPYENLPVYLKGNALTAVNTTIDRILKDYQIFITQSGPNEQTYYHRLHSYIESLKNSLVTQNIFHASLDPNNLNTRIHDELEKLDQANNKVNQLEKDLKSLTEKAVAGSLSKAFTDLRIQINKQRRYWFFIVCTTTIIIGWYISYITNKTFHNSQNLNQSLLLLYWSMRAVIISPAVYFLWFAMSQYRRERSLVQEYDHRAAVAVSLPSYKGQVNDSNAKDNISVAASGVIFDTPSISEKEIPISKLIKQLSDLSNLVRK